MPVRYVGSARTAKTSNPTLIVAGLCDATPLGIPSTSLWMGAASIPRSRMKTCIVARPRTSRSGDQLGEAVQQLMRNSGKGLLRTDERGGLDTFRHHCKCGCLECGCLETHRYRAYGLVALEP